LQKAAENLHWQRRINLQVALRILQVDPLSVKDQQDYFAAVCLKSFITPEKSSEHEFISLLLSSEFNTHPLLQKFPYPETNGKHWIAEEDFMGLRVPSLEGERSRFGFFPHPFTS
jgi:hypothetical protein